MRTVNIHEAKTQLSSLLSMVEAEREHVMICRAGKPIAEIIPYQKKRRSVVEASLRPLKVKGDLTLPSSDDWDV